MDIGIFKKINNVIPSMVLPTQNPETTEYTAIAKKLLHNGNKNVPIVTTTKAIRYNVILLICRKSTINPVRIRPSVFVTPIKDTNTALSAPGIPCEIAKSGMYKVQIY